MKTLNNRILINLLLLIFFSLATSHLTHSQINADKNQRTGFFEIQQDFYDKTNSLNVNADGYYLQNGEMHKYPGYKQFKRWEWFWQFRVDPVTGHFPTTSVEDIRKTLPPKQGTKDPDNWTSLGPNSSGGGYEGIGRINCIAFRPGDNDVIYAGSPSGGLWKSTDAGSSWIPLTDQNAVLGVSDVAVIAGATTENDILYIATGDRDLGALRNLEWGYYTDNHSLGVLRSTDGGATWIPTGLTFTASAKETVNRILIDPNNNDIIYAATSEGTYKSVNAGTGWIQLNTYEFVDMEFKPESSYIIYGGTRIGGKIYRTIDAGENWSLRIDVIGGYRTELAVTPDNTNRVYAVIADGDGGLEAIYRSDDSGDAFVDIYEHPTTGNSNDNLLAWDCYPGALIGGQGDYDLAIAADPNDATVVYVGGINTWKSVDGANTFSLVTHWENDCGSSGQVVHADKHAMVFQNGTSVFFEGNDGGIYKTEDEGSTWEDLSNGMVISQVYRMGVSQTNSGIVITGLQDNGTKVLEGTWSHVLGTDGMDCAIDYTVSTVQYGTKQQGRLYLTTNNWASSTYITPGGLSQWVTPLTIDPNAHNTIYFGQNSSLYKSVNTGTTWTLIGNFFCEDITCIAVAPANSLYIYAAHTNILHKTDNGGSSWSDITGTLPVLSSFITWISVDEDDPEIVWVALGEYDEHSVYESIDGGTTWTNISEGLPEVPVMCVIQNHNNDVETELYAATDAGVYQKTGDDEWISYSDGLPNVVVTELEIYYDDLDSDNSKIRAATYGRGTWESDLPPAQICTMPVNLASNNITNTSADISWESDEGLWNIEYGESGFIPGGGTIISGIIEIPYTLSELEGETDYDFYVQSDCAEPLGYSEWAGPHSFTTLMSGTTCEQAQVISSIPFSAFGLSTEGTGDDYNTAGGSNPCGTNYMEGEDYVFEYTPISNITIRIVLSGTEEYTGFFIYDGCPDDPETSCIAMATSTETGNPSLYEVYLPVGTTYYIIVDTWPPPDYTPFDIEITIVACPAPSDLSAENITGNSAELNWTSGGSDTWNIEWGTGGFISGEGTLIEGVTDNPYLLSGLEPTSPYDFYIQDDCSAEGNGVSEWIGPHSFFTSETCPMPDMLWTEGETATTAELHWSDAPAVDTWNIEYGESDVMPGMGTLIEGVVEIPLSLSGLTPSTSYWFRVQSDCNAAGGGESSWTMPSMFSTLCGTFPTPFSEGFENWGMSPDCWTTEYITGFIAWMFQSGSVMGTPPAAHTGSYNACLYSWETDNHITRLISPPINLTSLASPTLYFWHAQAENSGNQDELTVFYRVDDSHEWAAIPGGEFTGNTPSWTKRTLILPDPSGSYQIAFSGNAKGGGGICIDDVSVDEAPVYVWTGADNNNWGNSENWDSEIVPSAIEGVVIPTETTYLPVIFTGEAMCRNLNIHNGAVLTISAHAAITVSDDIIINGNNCLIIESDESGSGSLINNGEISGTGSAIIQQYLIEECWHLVSPPISNAVIEPYLDIYLKEFNENDNSWTYLVNPLTIPMNPAQGYSAWASDALTGTTLVNFSGLINTGDYLINDLSYTPASSAAGWNLVGNPYPSSLQWNSAWTKTDVSEWMCVHNNGNDACYNALTGTEWPNPGDLPDGIIPPTQGFWIRAFSADASITIPQSQRLHSSQNFYKNISEETIPSIRLRVDGNNGYDVLLVQFVTEATAGYDPSFDLEKRWGYSSSPQIYAIIDSAEYFSVNVLPDFYNGLCIPVGFEAGTQEIYSLYVSEFSGIGDSLKVWLRDNKEGTLTELSISVNYTFTAAPCEPNHRFDLLFSSENMGIPSFEDNFRIYHSENKLIIENDLNLTGIATIYDLAGRDISGNILVNGQRTIIPLSVSCSGYIVTLKTESGIISRKIITGNIE